MLDRVDDKRVSIARLCNRARPDKDGLGEDDRSPSIDENEEKARRGVLGTPAASCEAALFCDDMLVLWLSPASLR